MQARGVGGERGRDPDLRERQGKGVRPSAPEEKTKTPPRPQTCVWEGEQPGAFPPLGPPKGRSGNVSNSPRAPFPARPGQAPSPSSSAFVLEPLGRRPEWPARPGWLCVSQRGGGTRRHHCEGAGLSLVQQGPARVQASLGSPSLPAWPGRAGGGVNKPPRDWET